MKIALVHDWLVSAGGAEQVLWTFHKIYPNAPIYTLVYDPACAAGKFKECDIHTTYIQKIPFSKKLYKNMLPLMPKAWESLDLTEYDVILSDCSSCCKGVITRPDALHICYCHTPTRYIWDLYYEYKENAGLLKKVLMPGMIHKVRIWDRLAADRVDYFIANSEFTAQRIEKFYKAKAEVIYPCGWNNVPEEMPVVDQADDYYLVVCRLVAYKRVDIAIQTCNQLKKNLIVIGDGDEMKNLNKIAGETITFKGRLTNQELFHYFVHAKALLFPGVEDFGSTPLEAQSGGCPVIAFRAGGVLETVLENKTGKFFNNQTTESLAACIEEFEKTGLEYTRTEIRKHSLGFSEERFIEQIRKCIEGHVKISNAR